VDTDIGNGIIPSVSPSSQSSTLRMTVAPWKAPYAVSFAEPFLGGTRILHPHTRSADYEQTQAHTPQLNNATACVELLRSLVTFKVIQCHSQEQIPKKYIW